MPNPLRVLLVEDSEDDAEVVLARLKAGGYAVTSERVETAEAMRAALNQRPHWDLIISDHAMPQFSAPAALAMLQGIGTDIPFIIVSSEISQQMAVDAMRAGAQDYVYKGDLARLLPAIERELREAALRHERHRAETQIQFQAHLLDLVEQAVLTTSISGQITYGNRCAERLFGQTAENLAGHRLGDLVTGAGPQAKWAALEAGLRRGASGSDEMELAGRGGETFPALITSSPLHGTPDQVTGAVHIIADLTEHKKVEEALRREAAELAVLREVDRLRSDLIANVSHELRTPLGLILVFCTTLLSGDARFEPDIHREFLHNIEDEARRLQHMLDEMLDSSRLQRGRVVLDRHRLDLPALVQRLLASQAAQLGEHPLKVEMPSTPLIAMGDSRAVEQVLRNLVSNAAKYSSATSPIVIEGRMVEGHTEISVHDQGCGITPQDMPQLFERFFRADNEVTRQTPGIGLGLSICRELLDLQGGRIWAESVPGQGSVFRFTLPGAPLSAAEK